jgi:hypothetical protein
MGKTYSTIDDAMRQFIEEQPLFFVGSAPLDPKGHVNISPKGLDTFRVLGPKTVAYLDLTGSGIETVAHVKENGRVVLMFCALQGPPKIVRLHGHGRVVEPGDPEFPRLQIHFSELAGIRSIIVVELADIADSCGFGVPLFQYRGQREQHGAWARKIGPEAIKTYQRDNNQRSRDGLPGLSG